MDATTTTELRSALQAALKSLRVIADHAVERHFLDIVDATEPYGAAVSAQHLRNKLLAYTGRSFKVQPRIGVMPAMRAKIGELVERLDGALLKYLEPPPFAAGDPGDKRRVLLLLDHLPPCGREWSQPRWICTYAAALALDPQVEAVCMLATQETAPESPFGVSGELGPQEEEGWRRELEEVAGGPAPKVQMVTVDRLGPVRPYAYSIARVWEFKPNVVLDYQGVFRSRLLPALLNNHTALVSVQLSKNNPEPKHTDLVLAHSFARDFSDKPTPDKWRTHTIPLVPFPKESTLDPGELGPASPLRIVTVLSRGRLERGLMDKNAAGLRFVISFLKDHPTAVWLLVAIEDPESFADEIEPFVPRNVAERLRLLPMMPDLRAIYEHCHIYMHLPLLEGGGMGIAMAVAEGLPVIAAKGTDAANLLPPNHTYGGWVIAADLLRNYAADAELRQERARRQRDKLERAHSLAAASKTLAPLLAEAMQASRERRSRVDAA